MTVQVGDNESWTYVRDWVDRHDEKSWRFLMTRFDPLIRRVFSAMGIRGTEDVADLLQDFWWEMSKSLGRWRGETKLAGYLAAIARRRGIDYIRKRINARKVGRVPEIGDTLADTKFYGSEPEILSLRESLDRCFQKLETDDRLLFFYREVEGWDVRETAAALNLAEGTVKSRLYRVKEKLKAWMKEEGYNGNEVA